MKTKQNERALGMMLPKTVGLISATDSEGLPLVKKLGLLRVPGSMPACFSGRIDRSEVIYIVSGMGKANAAHAAGVLLRDFAPGVVVNFGIGGVYPGAGLSVGDVAVASKEVYADEGVETTDGFQTLQKIAIPLVKAGGKMFFNEFPLDRSVFKKALKAARTVARAAPGVFVTVSTCTGTGTRAQHLRERLGGFCENMEGAAVAQVCLMYGIACAEIRGISNIVEDRDLARWDKELAAKASCDAVFALLAGWGRY